MAAKGTIENQVNLEIMGKEKEINLDTEKRTTRASLVGKEIRRMDPKADVGFAAETIIRVSVRK